MKKQPTMQFLRILWAQQIFTLAILGVVVHIQNGDQAANTEAVSSYGLFFTGFALVLIVGGLVFRGIKAGTHALPLLMNRADTEWGEELDASTKDAIKAEALLLYRTATIIGTACAEAAALCGFALAFMSKMTVLFLPFAGAAGAIILWQLPNQASLDAICAALEKKKRSEG